MRLIDADALIDRIKNPYEQAQVARWVNEQPTIEPEKHTQERTETHACDLIDRRALIKEFSDFVRASNNSDFTPMPTWNDAVSLVKSMPPVQPDIEKICTRIKAEAIKRNVEYMKHGDRYMLGFVDGMRLARRIVDGTIDDPVYFTLSGGIER